jgi:N-acetylneuraminic acid mutarotase
MKTIGISLVVLGLFVLCAVADAVTVQIDLKALGCPTVFYGGGTTWSKSFDLGVTFMDIQSVSIDWAGTMTGAVVYDGFSGQTLPADAEVMAYMGGLRFAAVDDGAATYPSSVAFDALSPIVRPGPSTDWSDLLDGKGTIELSCNDPLLIDGYVVMHGSGRVDSAKLIVEGTVMPPMVGSNSAWTWVSGPNSVNQPGIYGTNGVADAGNMPGARHSFVSWADGSGDLWLFGGTGLAAGGSSGYLNDLWKFDGTNWTWVSGSNSTNQSGVYGAKGVAAPSNVPGARYDCVSWMDVFGDLWLFGGYGYAASGSSSWLNDLWKFDGTNWTWVSGSDSVNSPGVFGTKGVASPVNVPPARMGSISWIDSIGNMWLFGGGERNDLWKFNGMWTWVSGSSSSAGYGVYGTKGVAAPGNVPGGRYGSISWIDASNNLWLFGGNGHSTTTAGGLLNDLWKFDGVNWTWVSGSNLLEQYGVYGTMGVADANNVPGARDDSVSWIDSSGRLWLLGGYGYTDDDKGVLNDLWSFDGAMWTWIGGTDSSKQYGIYGEEGVAASGNMPGTRWAPAGGKTADGKLLLFGGWGYAAGGFGLLNDLWKFGIPEQAADMAKDGVIDELDLATFAGQWLASRGALSADLAPQPAGDGAVDFRDFAVLAGKWLDSL